MRARLSVVGRNATSVATLAGLAAAFVALALLPAPRGQGAFAGYAAGALIAGLALGLQRRTAARAPRYVVHAVLGGFLAKAALMLALTLGVRFVEPLASTLDAAAFLLGFAAALLLVLVPGTIDTLRALSTRSLSTAGEARTA